LLKERKEQQELQSKESIFDMPTNYVQQRHKQKQFFLVFVFVLTFV
jgi:hypothetical protein